MKIRRTEANKILTSAGLRHAEQIGLLKAEVIDGRYWMEKKDVLAVKHLIEQGDLVWTRRHRGTEWLKRLFKSIGIGSGINLDSEEMKELDRIEMEVRKDFEKGIIREVTSRYNNLFYYKARSSKGN